MKPSGELHELIKSLTPHEKRYFRIASSVSKGDKLYLKLFDLIERQKTYDEAKLKAAFRDNAGSGSFAVTKNYLSGLLIKSLLAFHTDSSVDASLSRLYERSRLFYSRSLFVPYFKSLTGGKQLAMKYERFGYALEFIEMERQLVRKDKLKIGIAEKFYKEELSVIEKAKQINELRKRLSLLLDLRRQLGIARTLEEEAIVNATADSKIACEKYLSLTASERGLCILYHQAFMKCDFPGARKFAEMRMKLVTKNSHVFENSFPGLRDEARMDLVDAFLAEGRKSMAAKESAVFRREKVRTATGRMNIEITGYKLQLHESPEMKEADFRKLMEDLSEFLNLTQGKITIHTVNKLLYEAAKHCFERAEFRMSEHFITRLINKRNLLLVAEFGGYARMLRLLILFERGKKNMFAFHAEATMKTLRNRGKLYEPERTVIMALKKITRLTNDAEVMNELALLRESLKTLRKDIYIARAFEYIDYFKWIDSVMHRQEVIENMCLV